MTTPTEFIKASKDYWSGFFEAFEDFPDGAWWAAMETAFEDAAEIKACCDALEISPPTGCDGNDLVHEYLKQREE